LPPLRGERPVPETAKGAFAAAILGLAAGRAVIAFSSLWADE
jgi:hypothetical protein